MKKQRRLQNKTDFSARLVLLKSGKPRIVFRKTNRYIIGQYTKSNEARDIIEVSANSRDLLEFGWPKEAKGSLKSIPAAYLTGFLLGKKVSDKKGESSAILDIGLLRNNSKSRIYAFLKGVTDSGLKVPGNKEVFPDESRILGRHMKKNIQFEKVKQEITKNG